MKINDEISEIGLSRFIKASWGRGRHGSGLWMALAIVAATMRILRLLSKRKPRTVHRRELMPGQSVRIDHLQRKQIGNG
ncbi:MAG: hypothetical protein EVA19_01220 [Acidimicrobiales bacterium]|nr:MAG: hypothetical protein EVA19_01220 [Acidimicrobiales bacterium]